MNRLYKPDCNKTRNEQDYGHGGICSSLDILKYTKNGDELEGTGRIRVQEEFPMPRIWKEREAIQDIERKENEESKNLEMRGHMAKKHKCAG